MALTEPADLHQLGDATGGRQVQQRIGPVWRSKREEPPPGHFTKRTAQAALDETLAKARRGELGGVARTRATFAEAADEWLRYVEHDRERKRSTITDYRHMVDRMKDQLGPLPLTDLTPARLEAYRDALMARGLANRTVNKYLVALHGIFQRAMKVHGLPANRMTLVEKRPIASGLTSTSTHARRSWHSSEPRPRSETLRST